MAYVTTYDSTDERNWSGTGYHIFSAFSRSGIHATPIGDLKIRSDLRSRAKQIIYSRLLSRTYFIERTPSVLWDYAAQVERRLSSIDCDVVFSPGTMAVAHLNTEKPIAFWVDATFAGMIGFYPEFKNLSRETVRDGNRAEQSALTRCRVAIYASEWAAETARRNYDVDPARVRVVPFGANIDSDRDPGSIRTIISAKETGTCRLLFLGVDWVRKGGDVAVKVAEILNRRGIRTELHVVGCEPQGAAPAFVKPHGFISKSTGGGRALLDALFRESHFLIVPSRAECYGVVFAEASSYGLPSLATDVGGIPSAVHNDRNGRLFSPEDEPGAYSEYISRMLSSRPDYEHLCQSSFQEYTGRLNWATAISRVHDLLREFCG